MMYMATPRSPTLGERFDDLVQRILLAIDDRHRRSSLRCELVDLENRNLLDTTLQDIGLSRAHVPALVRGFPQRQRLLRRMMSRLGLRQSQFGGRDAHNAVAWTCTTCTESGRCQEWLDGGKSRGHEDFCPNAEALRQMAGSARR